MHVIASVECKIFEKPMHFKWHCGQKIPWHKENSEVFSALQCDWMTSGNTFTWHLIHSISVSSQSLIFPSALSHWTQSYKKMARSVSVRWMGIQMEWAPFNVVGYSARMRRRRRRGFQSAWINTFVFKQTNCTFYYHHTVWWPFWLHCAFARLSSSFSHSQ